LVSNPLYATIKTGDPASAITVKRSQKIRAKGMTDQDALSIIEAARPHGGRRRDSHAMALRRTWFVNLLNYAGIQNLDVDQILENVDPGLLNEQGGYVGNHILRLVMGNVARLTSARVDWSVIPNTPDQVDQEGAKVGQHLLDHLFTHLELGKKRLKIGFWLDTVGTCFAYSNWDPRKGQVRKFYYDPLTSQPISQQQLAPGQKEWLDALGVYDELPDGDHDDEVISAFDVWLPTRFTEMKKMPWVLIRRTYSLEDVFERWPKKIDDLPEEEMGVSTTDHYRNRLPSLVRRTGLVFGSAGQDDGGIDVDEFWMPNSARVPGGLYIAAVKDHVMEVGPNPFAEAGLDIRFPLIDFHNIPMPGRFHAMSTVEHLIGPQMEYNRARQQIIQHRDILSVPQWVAPIGTLAKKMVRNEIGDVMEYNPRIGKPELVAPPPLGDATLVSGEQAKSDLQMISSFSDASLGNMPQGARSGNAVAMLQERDQLGVGPTVQELESSFERWGRHLLMLEWKFAKVPRTIQVYGESRQADIRYFKGSDLNGNTRVSVKAGSMTPKSKAATLELMTQMMQLGLLNTADPKEKRLVMQALQIGGHERLYHLEDGSRRRAKIENLMFFKPAPGDTLPDVMMWDDHQAHYEEHLEALNTDEYELLPPMLKLMFQAHLNKHIGAIADAMIATAAAQGAAAGGMAPEGQGAKPLGKPSPPSNSSQPKSGPNP
jgi:hypothetical protein